MTKPVALITGASSGIGAEFARQLSARGYELILVARRSACSTDLTLEEGIAATENAIRGCDRLELLINNAGFGTLGRFWEADAATQIRMHELHVMATARLTHAALGDMVRRGRGAVINVSSVAGLAQSPGNVSYCATKAWMTSFTVGLDMELRSVGSPVKVQALCPAYTRSEFHETMGMNPAKVPGIFWLTAEEVVRASLRGLERGKAIVYPGWQSKVAAVALKYLAGPIVMGLRPGGKRA